MLSIQTRSHRALTKPLTHSKNTLIHIMMYISDSADNSVHLQIIFIYLLNDKNTFNNNNNNNM